MLRQRVITAVALLLSFGLHIGLLTLRIVDPESFNRVFRDTPLDVILVNARSEELPDQAKAIAQTSLAGGGDAQRGRATSPLPSAMTARVGETPEEEERQIQALKERQNQILALVRRQLATLLHKLQASLAADEAA